MHSSQQEDSYQQIIPGIPQGSLYSTLSSLSSEAITSQEEAQSLREKVSKGLEKYLQDAEQCLALEVNYFNNNARCASEELNLEDTEQTIQSSKGNRISPKQMSIEDINVARNAPEFLESDTGHISRQHLPICTDADGKHQQIMTSEDTEQDTNAQHCDGKHPAKKVGCILVTSHLKQFLEDYPLSSDKQAFLNIYHMLSLLDKYLYDNPKQHTHCMSSDNEYITLLKYAFHLNVDLTMFPTLWVVLSILLDTQDDKHEHVKCLQEEYNTYYTDKSGDYMLKLEGKLVENQNHMYDSVTQNFDRVSGVHDNGSTHLQGQEDNQPVEVTTPENAIDNNVIDIRTIYPPWSLDMNDINNIIQISNDKSMKDIRDEMCKDAPLKTEINKPYIDNIDT